MIQSEYFIHPNDAKALDALKSIPGFTLISRKYSEIIIERGYKILNLSSRLRISGNQLPEIYEMLPPICEKLEISVPELYLEQNPTINACTIGDTNPCIIVNSGLLNYCTKDVIRAVIAHECGHIVCHHTVYKNMARFFLGVGSAILNIPLLTFALKYALLYWDRCSEYSADRVSAYVCGGSEQVVKTMEQLSTGSLALNKNLNHDEFLKQAEDFRSFSDESLWNNFLMYYQLVDMTHPFLADRALDIVKWCESDDFTNLCNGVPYCPNPDVIHCPKCGCVTEKDSSFCASCGAKIVYCPNCGAVVSEDDVFCDKCGSRLS